MKFIGINRTIPVDQNYSQIKLLGKFWSEMKALYPNDDLLGLGVHTENGTFEYYIGRVDDHWITEAEIINIPDEGWVEHSCKLDDHNIMKMYKQIYKNGKLDYEIESMKNGIFRTKIHYAN